MPSSTPSRPPRNRNPRPPRNRAASGPQHWMWDATCATADPDLFYPAERRDPGIPEAKDICAYCPVKADCLQYSLTAREEFGIWGGLDEWERRELLDKRRRQRLRDGSQGAA